MCEIIQLFECHFLSMKELVEGIYSFGWYLPSSTAIPNLCAIDPGGALKLWERSGECMHTPPTVCRQSNAMHTHADTYTY